MGKTITDGLLCVEKNVRAIHGLKQKIVEGKVRETLGRRIRLRIDEFQFVAAGDRKAGSRLGTDADPVDALRR